MPASAWGSWPSSSAPGDERPRHHGDRGARCYFPTRLKSMKPRSTSTVTNCTRTRCPTSRPLNPATTLPSTGSSSSRTQVPLSSRSGHHAVELLPEPRSQDRARLRTCPPGAPPCWRRPPAWCSGWRASRAPLRSYGAGSAANAALSRRWVIRSVNRRLGAVE